MGASRLHHGETQVPGAASRAAAAAGKGELEMGLFLVGCLMRSRRGLGRHHLTKEPSSKTAATLFVFHSRDLFGLFFWVVSQPKNKKPLNVMAVPQGSLSFYKPKLETALAVSSAAWAVLCSCSQPGLCRCWVGFLWASPPSVLALLVGESRPQNKSCW